MKTISKNINAEIIIKNSKFITHLYKLENNNYQELLNNLKKEYPKATHYCYACIYNDLKYLSDDGEPTGTAGAPILNVLEKENLDNILAVVIRYFGGIKLGAGGLIRAYTKAVTSTLKEAEFIELIPGYRIKITFSYELQNQINKVLKNQKLIDKEFKEDIVYIVDIDKGILDSLTTYNYQILEDIYIEKKF